MDARKTLDDVIQATNIDHTARSPWVVNVLPKGFFLALESLLESPPLELVDKVYPLINISLL